MYTHTHTHPKKRTHLEQEVLELEVAVRDSVVVAVAQGAHHLLDEVRRHLLRVVVPLLVVQPAWIIWGNDRVSVSERVFVGGGGGLLGVLEVVGCVCGVV